MLIPLGTDRPLRRRTVVTTALIGANVAVHIALAAVAARDPDAYERILTDYPDSVQAAEIRRLVENIRRGLKS